MDFCFQSMIPRSTQTWGRFSITAPGLGAVCSRRKRRASDLDHFLMDRAGIRLTDLKTRFNWTYVPEYDSYYKQHGDTNYAEFLCEEGIEKDGKWQVKCRGQLLSEAEYVSTVTVEKTGDKYRFCANRIDVDGWLIKSNQAPVDTLAGLRTIVAAYRKSKGFTDRGFDQSVFDTDTRFYTMEELAVLDPKLYPASWKPLQQYSLAVTGKVLRTT